MCIYASCMSTNARNSSCLRETMTDLANSIRNCVIQRNLFRDFQSNMALIPLFGLRTVNRSPLKKIVQLILVTKVGTKQPVNLLVFGLTVVDWRVGSRKGVQIIILFCTTLKR